ncbi:MAG: methyltransferase domain-containing protein [Gaiellaceae bacterium]
MTRDLRTTFEQAPDLYDRARPRYPDAVFDDLAELAGLLSGARVCEVGCGTGQASLPLAERGYRLTCVELGTQLATVAARKLGPFSNAEVVNADFETWRPETGEFDAVVAFTSFHWLDPAVRYAKPVSLLRPGGALAVVATHHVLPADGDPFFVSVQEDYEAILPDDPKTAEGPPPQPDAIGDLAEEIAATDLFHNVGARRYVWDVTYTADEYIDVLSTYSGHRALDEERRRALFERIRRRIGARPGGRVRKTYLALLNVARSR